VLEIHCAKPCCTLDNVHLRENVSLARYTTFDIGGPARWFTEAETESDILEACAFARNRAVPLQVLGGGSNVLIADKGFDGLVLHVALRGIREVDGTLEVAAGEEWDPVVAYTVARDLAGLECLSGIPGLTGGTPVQNVGAYGQEVSQTITQVRAYDREAADFVDLSNAECGFSYRASIFNSSARDRYIVTRVTYRLVPGGAPSLSYADLQRHFAGQSETPTLLEVRDAVRSIRFGKGMLIVPGDPDSRSAGSFFRNPIVTTELHHDLNRRYGTVPSYPVDDMHVKLPAAWLVEHAGFCKGYTLGRAGVSSKHTLALTNRGRARAADILALRDQITRTVEEKFGIRLEPEPVYIG
jgi:UDP-N-acetylmuramate dehydrogenase